MSNLAYEKAMKFIDQRQATVDKWISKETQKEKVSIAYWLWTGKQKQRVFAVDDTIELAVELCQNYEDKSRTPKASTD